LELSRDLISSGVVASVVLHQCELLSNLKEKI